MADPELQKHINDEQKSRNDRQDEINERLFQHASIANEEMGVIKTDIQWLKEKMSSMDSKLMTIMIAMIGLLGSVIAALIKNLF